MQAAGASAGGMRGRAWTSAFRRVAAACLLVVCAWRRPDVALAVVLLGAVFIGLERRWPVVEQRVLRAGWSVDVVHFVVDQVVGAALIAALAIVTVPYLEPMLPNMDTLTGGWWRIMATAVVGEVCGYWGHRMMHRVPVLWRLHAVHHSSPVMDWLAPNRRHVLDTALGQAASAIPLLALGLSPPVVVSAFALRRAQGLFVHANLRVHLPVVRWVVATPEFHHWHHSADPAHHDCNFAGQCPFVDRLFGTLHMPAREWPERYGIASGADAAPASYLARLWWPFRGMSGVLRRRAKRCVAAASAILAVISGAVVAAAALEPGPMLWSYHCTARVDERPITVHLGVDGVILIDHDGRRDVTSVRNVDGDPSIGVGLRVVRAGGAPLTMQIGAGVVGSIVTFTMLGAEGTSSGTCARRPDALVR